MNGRPIGMEGFELTLRLLRPDTLRNLVSSATNMGHVAVLYSHEPL